MTTTPKLLLVDLPPEPTYAPCPECHDELFVDCATCKREIAANIARFNATPVRCDRCGTLVRRDQIVIEDVLRPQYDDGDCRPRLLCMHCYDCPECE